MSERAYQAVEALVPSYDRLLRTKLTAQLRQRYAEMVAQALLERLRSPSLATVRNPSSSSSDWFLELMDLKNANLGAILEQLADEAERRTHAFDIAIELVKLLTVEGVPPPTELRAFTFRVLNRDLKRPATKGRTPQNYARNLAIRALVERAKEADPNLDYTSTYGGEVTACSIVAAVLASRGIRIGRKGEDQYYAIARIWTDPRKKKRRPARK